MRQVRACRDFCAMASSFGRRGLASPAGNTSSGAATFGSARNFGAGFDHGSDDRDPEDEYSPQMRAFLAEERKSRGAGMEPGISEIAARTSIKPKAAKSGAAGTNRSMVLAYVLWYFAAAIAAHRFYLGAIQSAIAMTALFWVGLLTMYFVPSLGLVLFGGWFIWAIVDMFLIPGMVRATRAAPDMTDVFA